jgi:uncharacterized protein (TIGR02757 family)
VLLERLVRDYDARRLDTDPLRFPRRYAHDRDREVAALIAAVLSYGNARTIGASVERALEPFGSRPAAALRASTPRELRMAFRGFRHRWTRGRDMAALVWRVAEALRQHGSLRALFLRGYEPSEPNVGPSLTRFVDALLAYDGRPVGAARIEPRGSGIRHLLVRPADRSACKRLNLFLRWVVRADDGLDLGLWPEVSTRGLVIPLDTHSSRVSRALGFTRRATTDWRAAEEVTEALRRYDPDDPVRYDFALCHVSMSGDWQGFSPARRGSGPRLG